MPNQEEHPVCAPVCTVPCVSIVSPGQHSLFDKADIRWSWATAENSMHWQDFNECLGCQDCSIIRDTHSLTAFPDHIHWFAIHLCYFPSHLWYVFAIRPFFNMSVKAMYHSQWLINVHEQSWIPFSNYVSKITTAGRLNSLKEGVLLDYHVRGTSPRPSIHVGLWTVTMHECATDWQRFQTSMRSRYAPARLLLIDSSIAQIPAIASATQAGFRIQDMPIPCLSLCSLLGKRVVYAGSKCLGNWQAFVVELCQWSNSICIRWLRIWCSTARLAICEEL